MMNKIKTIWENRKLIFQGIKNLIFKKHDVEQIARKRMTICVKCPSDAFDSVGHGCMVPGTQPCCSLIKGGCGCSLGVATRSLSKACPKGHWKAVMSAAQEEIFRQNQNK